jgi:hypothetical protein
MIPDPVAARHVATSADGRVRAIVDGSGRLVELTLGDDLLRRPPWTVAAAVVETVTAAQDVASAAAGPPGPSSPGGPALDLRWLADATEAASVEADRQVSRLQTTIDNLVRAWERR